MNSQVLEGASAQSSKQGQVWVAALGVGWHCHSPPWNKE